MTQDLEEAVGWRHELHRHPELLFDLPWTARFIADHRQRLMA